MATWEISLNLRMVWLLKQTALLFPWGIKQLDQLTRLSLSASGWRFSPGTMKMTSGYFHGKVEKKRTKEICSCLIPYYLTINEWGRVPYEELWRSRKCTASTDDTLQDLHNSSCDMKAKFNNCFIIHSK